MAAAYHPDKPVVAENPPKCTACGQIKPMTWPEALSHLQEALKRWLAEGRALASPEVEQARLNTCKQCPHYRWFQCRLCKCVVAVKVKLPMEECPVRKWTSVVKSA